jgi:hypothetical protein
MEEEVFEVCELKCNVETTGVKLWAYVYPASKTPKFYSPLIVTPALRERGYSYGMHKPIRHEDMGVIMRSGLWDSPTNISRYAFYLKEQEEETMQKMRENIEQTIESLYTNANLLRSAWQNRPTKPDHHEERIRKVDKGKAGDGVAVS